MDPLVSTMEGHDDRLGGGREDHPLVTAMGLERGGRYSTSPGTTSELARDYIASAWVSAGTDAFGRAVWVKGRHRKRFGASEQVGEPSMMQIGRPGKRQVGEQHKAQVGQPSQTQVVMPGQKQSASRARCRLASRARSGPARPVRP